MHAFRSLAAALVAALALSPAPSTAEAWPQRTVRIIVPLPAGSGTDIAARWCAERLAARWGKPVIVENRQGSDGIPAVMGVDRRARQPHLPVLVCRRRHHQSAHP